MVFKEGSYGTKFFFIIEGEVDILKQKKTLNQFLSNEAFSQMDIFQKDWDKGEIPLKEKNDDKQEFESLPGTQAT